MPDLNSRAAALMGDKVEDSTMGMLIQVRPGLVDSFYPEEDLNSAAKFWEAAPERVKSNVIAFFKWSHTKTSMSDELWTTWELYLANAFTKPAAITEAVVKAWEDHNAQR